ncbi:uncharacterized protein F4822DRAFT_433996 [Hypoxylon trugodes]|uniref:uncharacterized protein n=1 Tax=Hypoxylon trugodes TaxID=326681 RepID=UPI00219B3F5B|nr:uncharacterized protein F4822DRAFT_433996 [Hypoxylon trugodes]KAI1384047.1 hypothetical protein F4822DRAFT_433996 [Hypoxylon trugodes]
MSSNFIFKALAILAASSATVNAHSWVEEVRKIDSTGAFTDGIGYPIGYLNRSSPTFSDTQAQNKILDVKSNPAVCKPKANAYASLPRLNASAGDYAAMLYQENGHVTQPNITPRPYRDGLVYVYGTLHHEDSDGINDVLDSWTEDGKGGNGKGQLLATHYYDDGQCYQNAGNNLAIPIYAQRMKEFGLDELYCQTDFRLPDNLPSEGIYTVMWVWNWPLVISDTQNTTEIYTSCAEIQLGPAKQKANAKVEFSKNNKVNNAGIASQLANHIEATGLGIGRASPAPVPSGSATEAPDSSASPSPTSSSKKHHKPGVKTVTVTADAQTTTKWKTVTVNGDSSPSTKSKASKASTVASSPAQQTSTGSDAAQPTPAPNQPVSTVTKFMKARATGQARRDANDRS